MADNNACAMTTGEDEECSSPNTSEVYQVPEKLKDAHISGMVAYRALYEESTADAEKFWSRMAQEQLAWSRPFESVCEGSLSCGDVRWFCGGKLNVSYNCVDRHARTRPNQTAILWEGDEVSQVRHISYAELLVEVSRAANMLLAYGVRKGDRVAIYMPMVPEAAFAMLACARIGAVHSVVFAGFSAQALRSRILDARAKYVICADENMRGGRHIPLKRTVDEALLGCPQVSTVFMLKHTNVQVPWHPGRDVDMRKTMDAQRPYCPPVEMDAEDPLFILYTSGSTGQPKGLLHTQAGYLLYTSLTHKYIFDYKEGDVYACMADIGWITGHSYIVYGPLCNGATTVMFESIPVYPDAGRYWDMVQRHKITQFYTAPTAIRLLMKYGKEHIEKYDRSSLRVLGTVGEPINPKAWKFYYEVVGESKCAIADTFWQTETGGVVCSPLPGATPTKPGSASLPFFGVQLKLLDGTTGKPVVQPKSASDPPARGLVCIGKPWPGMARTVYGDHGRYLKVYMEPYPGYYFTGDGGYLDHDGYVWISGRVDDVINKAGHRLGTAEIESALVSNAACSEAAVIAIADDVKGQAIIAFCILAEGYENSPEADIIQGLRLEVRSQIGPIATPDKIVLVEGVPKTRSGKIMRRILRKVASGATTVRELGDISTLADPSVVDKVIEKMWPDQVQPSKKSRD